MIPSNVLPHFLDELEKVSALRARRRLINPVANLRARVRLKSGPPSARLEQLTKFLGRVK